ncbi:sigma-70 family RNA polymerase sigma factor [Streptomyces cynarae]|uniref:sigma-70 family RNA polymerase sigma factor n=1 Tax=Streptomyces cynarae TaxID=2981134 RepID=UPI00406CA278
MGWGVDDMRHQAADAQAVPVTRAALAELLTRLRGAALDGVVPDGVFMAQVQRLGLGDIERERLREELAKLGVLVRKSMVHAHIDTPDVEKVASKRGENVFARLAPVLPLLERYADAEGYVTTRVLEGVARLAGLNAREAAALREAAKVREPLSVGKPPDAEKRPDGPKSEPLPAASPSAAPTGAGLAAAVAAARVLLNEDRFRRRPEKYLLTAEEETGLSVLLRGGADRVDEEPDQETLSALPRDDIRVRARDCLVLHNQGLVHSLVRQHLEQGLDYEDLFQHGVRGLMRATLKFNATMGNKFSTYATWWVRQSLTRAIADEGALIRVPVHMHEQIRKVANAERSLAAQGRPATAADVAVFCDMTLQKVEEARRLSRRTDSLDRVVGDGLTLGDFVERTQPLPSVESTVLGTILADEIMAVVNTFTGRDHRILVRRLGLDGDDPSTLDEVGREFGVTRERIRQLEVKLRPVLQERVRKARRLGLRTVVRQEEPGSAKNAPAGVRGVPSARPARTVRRQPVSGGRHEASVPVGAQAARPAVTSQSGGADTVLPAESAPTAGTGPEMAAPAVVLQTAPTRQATSASDTEADSAPHDSAGDSGAAGDAPDWDRARQLAEEPSGQAWLAEYALAAVGHRGLAEFLGQPAADTIVRIAREREPAGLPVLAALETLRRVFDGIAEAGLRPEDFFDRPAEALSGATPRAYLTNRPLLDDSPRLAVRDALRELLATATPAEAAPATGHREKTQESRVRPQAETAVCEEAPAGAQERRPIEENELHPAETPTDATPQNTADWDKAVKLTQPPFGGGVGWLAEYALLAVGHPQLVVLLGSSAADAVVRSARQRGTLDRPVVKALEVLKGVFDAVKKLGLRPEHFFERPSEALVGVTPRDYLTARPLVGSESRLAVRDALREFMHAQAARTDFLSGGDNGRAPEEPQVASDDGSTPPSVEGSPQTMHTDEGSVAPAQPARAPADVDQLLADVRDQHKAELARLAQDQERQLAEERRTADERVATAQAETESQLDALEQELLHRVDRALALQEQALRRQAEERLARLNEEHREADLATTQRAEQRLRRYREQSEERIKDLEARLRQAETRLAARDRAVYEAGQNAAADVATAQQRAEAAEQWAEALVTAAKQAEARAVEAEKRAAARVAQAEHDAWVRITELQQQLAALEGPTPGRATLRDRWRRS